MASQPTALPSPGILSTRALLATLVTFVACAPAWPADLQSILAGAAVQPPAEIGFREERNNPMFKEPMVLAGRLEYLDAGVLRKVVEAPFEEDILVADDRVIVTRDGKTRKLSLNRSRALKTILGAIEAVLAGDQAQLEAAFRCDVSGSADAWSLQMTPLAKAVARRLSSIEVTGNEQAVTGIRISLPNDEWHQMQIGNDLSP
ncbi:MAG: hypothetical protein QNI96_07025 [Woeseiaceae bacterium]|nr:hypothetical protein [Woeseiaceae bacterium]